MWFMLHVLRQKPGIFLFFFGEWNIYFHSTCVQRHWKKKPQEKQILWWWVANFLKLLLALCKKMYRTTTKHNQKMCFFLTQFAKLKTSFLKQGNNRKSTWFFPYQIHDSTECICGNIMIFKCIWCVPLCAQCGLKALMHTVSNRMCRIGIYI